VEPLTTLEVFVKGKRFREEVVPLLMDRLVSLYNFCDDCICSYVLKFIPAFVDKMIVRNAQ